MRLNQDLIQRMFDGRGGASGGGSSLDPGLINGLATEMWTEENYVSKTFFNELFVIHKKTTTTVYDGDTVVSTTTDTSGTFAPNEIPSEEESTDEETGYRTVVVTEVDNIEAKKGLWTDFFLSALGLNGSGGGGGIGDVTWQALGDNTDTRQIASSHLTTALSSALAGYATQSWVTSQNYVTSSAISDMATKTWVNNQSFVNWTALGDTTTTQQIALSHLTTALSGYATQTWVTNNFSTPSSVATQMQTYAKIQNGTITIGDTSLTPITSVTGTFWGKSFTNGGTVNGTIKAGSNGGAIEQFHSVEMNSAGTLAGYGGFIDFHYYATGSTFDSSLDYTSRIIESEVGVISILAKNNNATNANKLAGLLVGAGYDGSYIQIGDLRIVYDSTNNALKVVKLVSGSEVAANFYATGSVSALGYGSGGGGGTGDVTWTNLADNTDTRQIALSHLTGALSGYATTSQLAGYLPLTGGTLTGVLNAGRINCDYIYRQDEFYVGSGYLGNSQHISCLYFVAYDKPIVMQGMTNVGIGTLNPTRKLQVEGSIYGYSFQKKDGTSSEFLKADGSVDSNTYLTSASLSDYVTLSTNQTISGLKLFSYGRIELHHNTESDIVFYSGNTEYLYMGCFASYGYISWQNSGVLLSFYHNQIGIRKTAPSYTLDINGTLGVSGQISSSLATGTAPISVTSTTVCTNLNADLLDGQHGTYYAAATALDGYLPLTGGTLTGILTAGRINCDYIYRQDEFYVGSGYLGNPQHISCLYLVAYNKPIVMQGMTYVGINTLNPSYTLDINGTLGVSDQVSSSLATGTAPISVTSTTVCTNLNADLLDGQHGSYYAAATSLDNYLTLTAGSSKALTGQLISSVATGTAPISVTSTTVCTNLNADLLDGQHGSYYAAAASLSNYLPLTGGTLTGQLVSSITTGTAPISVTSTTVCTNLNADLLDGQHGSYYATASSVTTLQGYFTNGSAKTAIKLATAVNLWGRSFDGSSDISGALTATGITCDYIYKGTDFYVGDYSHAYGGSTKGLVFYVYNGDLLISNPAHVGIGTRTPSYYLHVNGTFCATNTAIFENSIATGTSGGAIEGFQSWELNTHNTAGTNIGGFLDFHYNGTAQDYSVRLIEKDYSGVLQIMAKDTGTGNAQRAGLIVGAGTYTSFIQIGNGRIVWNDSDHALRIVDKDGNACNLYATGGISALGYQSGGGGGGSTGVFSTNITPETANVYDVGTSGYKWRNLYIGTVYGSTLKANTITITVDSGGSASINAGNAMGMGVIANNLALTASSGVLQLSGSTQITSNRAIDNVSDINLKDIIDYVDASVEKISMIPLFDFKYKNDMNGETYLGTSAQVVRTVFRNAVRSTSEGILTMDYGSAALAAAVLTARKTTEHERRITKLEKENAELRARIKDLEEN